LRRVKHPTFGPRRASRLAFTFLWALGLGQGARARAADAPTAAHSGADFIVEARQLFHLVACTGDAPLPEAWPSPLLRQHCKVLQDQTSKYRSRWIDRSRALLARVVPANLPTAVVYPFGGGDLVTALATFPNAQELTTISLEGAGDIRAMPTMDKKQLQTSLDSTREHLRCLFAVSHSKTTNLRAGSHSSLPGEIAFALVAFSIFDYEPVSLRYFKLDAQGKVVYLQASELGSAGVPWPKDGGPNPTANVEMTFRSKKDPAAPVRVFRHFAANLDDTHFVANQPLALHLTAKGRVAVLIKAASYLLWFDTFSHIRSYLLDHAEWMISDSTGVPPSFARAAGFEQECYGLFHGPFLAKYSHIQTQFLALWQASPTRMLPFYFGYPDVDGHGHMMITRRAGTGAQSGTSEPATDQVSGGNHWRLLTEKGPVHVWQPRGYDSAKAGTVVYVHGYYTNVDGAWVQHALAEQFAASKANALFIVPEAPAGGSEDVFWPVLGDLLKEVERQLPGMHTRSPVVVAGHSGAWRTISGWTDDKRVESFLLLDALYGAEDKFQDWLARHPGSEEPRMTLVTKDTATRAEPFLAQIPTAKRRAELPEELHELSPIERRAQVLEIHPDLSHMEIITTGKVLPVLLRRSQLAQVRAPRFGKDNVKDKKSDKGTSTAEKTEANAAKTEPKNEKTEKTEQIEPKAEKTEPKTEKTEKTEPKADETEPKAGPQAP
jgi:hypothetical protein